MRGDRHRLEACSSSPAAQGAPDLPRHADVRHAFELARLVVGGMVMSGAAGMAETVSRQWVTSGFFEVLGVTCRKDAFEDVTWT